MQQIESQQKTIDSLTNALASAQEAQTRLTESLAAEQALHAGTIQKQLTMQDEKPVGFWGRLFGKKKKRGCSFPFRLSKHSSSGISIEVKSSER